MSHRHDPQQLNQPGVPKDEFALEEIIREFSPKKKRAPQSKLSDDTMAFTPVTAQSRPPKPTDAQDTTVLPRIPDAKLSTKPAMPPEPKPAACSSDTMRLPRIPDGKIYTKQAKRSEKKAAALTSDTMRLPDLKTLNAALAESRTDDDAILTLQLLCHILFCEIFRIDECNLHLVVVVGAGM